MFAPSFFTGSLIKRYGVINIMLTGVVLNFCCIGIALGGPEVVNFWGALVVPGIGWNFMFIGGSTLLTECHTPAEWGKAQGVNDLAIYITMAGSSLSPGLLFTLQGWRLTNQFAIPFLLFAGAPMLWLAARQRRAHAKI